MIALDELIARLEKATGPDRELDATIGEAVGWAYLPSFAPLDFIRGRGLWFPPITPEQEANENPSTNDAAIPEQLPRFTSSIDAALTLVPDGLHWACAPAWEAREHRVYRPYRGVNEWIESIGEHKHDAIALCIAALKARNAIASPVVPAAPCPPTGEARDGGNQ